MWERAAAPRERYPDAAVIGAATVEHHPMYARPSGMKR
ncbi:hypothetical protein [Streptomyces bottropensis]